MSVTRVTLLLLFCCVVAAGCGKKSMLVPPQDVVPVAVSGVQYVVNDSGVTVSWEFPRLTESGAPLAEIDGFDVQVAEISPEKFCEGCPVVYDMEFPIAGGKVSSQRVEYLHADLKSGHHYFFRVRARTGRWAVGSYSEAVTLVW